MSAAELFRHSFPTMGTEIELLLLGRSEPDARDAFELAETLAAEWMRTFSRFDESSELSRLNAAGRGQVSPTLFEALDRAVQAARLSRGAFSPLVLPALVAAGYDRSFEHLPGSRETTALLERTPGVESLLLDAEARYVELPAGGGLDLNGIAKGLYADELAGRLARWPGGVVSAGGDMRVWGVGPDDGRWAVGIEPPDRGPDDLAVVTLNAGGLATSGVSRRAWRNGNRAMHHLIDPHTGQPASTHLATVTIIAPSATLAETAATALFVDPSLATYQPFSAELWGLLAVDGDGRAAYTSFDLEAPFHVYFTQ